MKKLLKKFYSLLPFKKEVFTFIKYFWKPPKNIYQHLHFKGIIDVSVEGKNSFKIHHYGYQIENELFWEGLNNAWEKTSMKIWKKLSKQAKVIIDIGAYSGLYSLSSACLNPNAKIYAFEPMKHNFNLLEKNITLNNYKNIFLQKKACSNYTGKAKVFVKKIQH